MEDRNCIANGGSSLYEIKSKQNGNEVIYNGISFFPAKKWKPTFLSVKEIPLCVCIIMAGLVMNQMALNW